VERYSSYLILFLIFFAVLIILSVLPGYYIQGSRHENYGNNENNEGNEANIRVYYIPGIGSPIEAFEEGYIDDIVYIIPEIREVSISNLNISPNTIVKIKLIVRYAARRDPAPILLKIVFDVNKASTLIPSSAGYIRVEDYLYVKPNTVYVSVERDASTYLYINFTKALVDAIKYNRVKFGSSEFTIDVYAYTTANKPYETENKYIMVVWWPDGIKIKP